MKLQDRIHQDHDGEMQLKRLLNHVQKHKGFVYDDVQLVKCGRTRLVVSIRPRRGSRATCSGCGKRSS